MFSGRYPNYPVFESIPVSLADTPSGLPVLDVDAKLGEKLENLLGSGIKPAASTYVREDAWMGISAALFASVLVMSTLLIPLLPQRRPHKISHEQQRRAAKAHPDATDAATAIIPPPINPRWPGPARTALLPILLLDESADGYGLRAGFWRLHRLLAGRLGLTGRVTVFATPGALRRCPAAAAAAREAGWELGLLVPPEQPARATTRPATATEASERMILAISFGRARLLTPSAPGAGS